MTVARNDRGIILLKGSCPVEDAEPLLQLLQATPDAPVDLTGCRQLHTAVYQVLLAAGAALIGPCEDRWIRQWLVPKLGQEIVD